MALDLTFEWIVTSTSGSADGSKGIGYVSRLNGPMLVSVLGPEMKPDDFFQI